MDGYESRHDPAPVGHVDLDAALTDLAKKLTRVLLQFPNTDRAHRDLLADNSDL